MAHLLLTDNQSCMRRGRKQQTTALGTRKKQQRPRQQTPKSNNQSQAICSVVALTHRSARVKSMSHFSIVNYASRQFVERMIESKLKVFVAAVCYYICCDQVQGFSPVSVITTTIIPDQTPDDVQNFLASPGNWPKIVSTSMGVSSKEDVARPLPVGKEVDELFGLPPILPLYVTWTCTKSKLPSAKQNRLGRATDKSNTGRLEFFSPHGLKGVAANCEMIFEVKRQEQQSAASFSQEGTEVVLNMKYEPQSLLAILVVPVLTLDNAVALQFLLPLAMRKLPELDKFRNLMGTLYLGAGLAHLVDCLFGGSQLLTMAGAPPFELLPLTGQIYALLWCIMGGVSFGLSRLAAGFADIGLLLYGLVEIGGAGLIAATSMGEATGMNPFINAILLQGVVAASWYYSANKAQVEMN